jgi:hypothetical protein
VLLKPREIRPLLAAIRSAAAGAGENETTLGALDEAIANMDVKATDYLAFGFDPWKG